MLDTNVMSVSISTFSFGIKSWKTMDLGQNPAYFCK